MCSKSDRQYWLLFKQNYSASWGEALIPYHTRVFNSHQGFHSCTPLGPPNPPSGFKQKAFIDILQPKAGFVYNKTEKLNMYKLDKVVKIVKMNIQYFIG